MRKHKTQQNCNRKENRWQKRKDGGTNEKYKSILEINKWIKKRTNAVKAIEKKDPKFGKSKTKKKIKRIKNTV